MTTPPYANADVTRPYASPPPAPPSAPNSLGKTALILALVVLALDFVYAIARAPLMVTGDHRLLGLVDTIAGAVMAILAIAALILGLIGITSRGTTKIAASLAVGVGVALVIGTIAGALFSFLISISFR